MDYFPKKIFFNGFNIGAEMCVSYDELGENIESYHFPSLRVPRIRLVRGIPVQSQKEALSHVMSPEYDVLRMIPVEITDVNNLTSLEKNIISAQNSDAPVPDTVFSPNSGTKIIQYSPERIEVHTDANHPAALFIADAYAKGWSATIDGQSAEIRPGLVAGRAIFVPEGQHQVIMTYKTPGLKAGIILAVLGWLSLLVLFISTKLKKQPCP